MSKSEAEKPITVDWGRQQVVVSAVSRELPDASRAEERTKLVQAGLANPTTALPEDAWHAVARASVAPELVAVQVKASQGGQAGLLLEEHVDGATLRSVHSRVWLSELFPGIQPRTGQEVLDTEDPQVQGMAGDGQPRAILRYRYRDPAHLKQHVWQTIAATLHLNSYEESILSRRVTRALIAHPVVFEFEDGTEPVSVLVARDGITRLASAWKVLAGPLAGPEEVAGLAVDALFAERRQPAGEPAKPLTQRMALGREAHRKRLHQEFRTESAGRTPSLRALQIAQTYVVPAHIAVGAQAHEHSALDPEDVFDDALRGILASVHVEFRQWEPAAQNVEVATRALKRVVQTRANEWGDGALRDVYALALGQIPSAETPRVYGDARIPGTDLWRAVCLLHALTRPEVFEELKARAKEIKGDRRMTSKGYAGLLGPLVDLPWRAAKRSATKQARNAWSNGGALCEDVLADGWVPVPTDDFTTLVGPAVGGDPDARCTLALAGGTALIADKLLTRNVGSAVATAPAPGKVPFRADVSTVVGGLARKGNEEGLWILALAAQRFEPDRLPRNASTRRQLGLRDEAEPDSRPYQHAAVDLAAPDRIRRDGTEEVALTQWDVVYASDVDRALATTRPPVFAAPQDPATQEERPADGDGTRQTSPAAPALSVNQRIAEERQALAGWLSEAQRSVNTLRELGQGISFPPLFGSADQWQSLRETTLGVLQTLMENAPENAEDDDADGDADE